MKNANWLSRNVRSIIGLMVVTYVLNFLTLVLVFKLGTPDLIDRMETSLNNVLMFVLGYYFSANHINPNQTQITNEKVTPVIP
jgi:hypothetical protein